MCYIRSGPTCGKGARLEARSIYGAVVVVEELQEIQQLVFFVKMPFMNQILAVDAVIGPQGVEWRLLHGHHRVTRPLRHCAAPPRSTAVDPLSIDVEGQHIRAEDHATWTDGICKFKTRLDCVQGGASASNTRESIRTNACTTKKCIGEPACTNTFV